MSSGVRTATSATTSFLGYFLMFVGLFLAWLNVVALVPLADIPGSVMLTDVEKELLTRRFGEEYTKYSKKTGSFLPKL